MKIIYKISIIIILFALLAIPDNRSSIHLPENNHVNPSAKWWGKFAQNLVKYRITSKQYQQNQYDKHRSLLINHLDELLLELTEPDNPKLDSISFHINKLSALASLLPSTIYEFEDDVMSWRKLLKYQSRYWDPNNEFSERRLSKFIIESKLAFESALIQSEIKNSYYNSSNKTINANSKFIDKTNLASGDIITYNLKIDKHTGVSYYKELPNRHKHLGMVYIKDSISDIIFMDAEEGLTSRSIDDFINLAPNAIILRLREDLPDILRNPSIPALAASDLYHKRLNGNYKYDFKFDLEAHDYLYDWELIDIALKSQGLTVTIRNNHRNVSSIYFGERNTYIAPSELELDNKFTLAGHWNTTESLYNRRLLTAATAALIEHHTTDSFLNSSLLPIYRLLKAYSMIADKLGFTAPIPTGVTAQTQLVFNNIKARQTKLTTQLKKEINSYEQARNHKATYLKMIQKANELATE